MGKTGNDCTRIVVTANELNIGVNAPAGYVYKLLSIFDGSEDVHPSTETKYSNVGHHLIHPKYLI
jgi:hypothetical protein